jgi:hypothetical protein
LEEPEPEVPLEMEELAPESDVPVDVEEIEPEPEVPLALRATLGSHGACSSSDDLGEISSTVLPGGNGGHCAIFYS